MHYYFDYKISLEGDYYTDLKETGCEEVDG